MPSVKKLAASQKAATTTGSSTFSPPARGEASPSAPSSSLPREGAIEVLARHAIQGVEVKVTLPKHARFKHVKQALANLLGSNEVMTRGQLMKKDAGIYNAFKDNKKIGDVRQVLVVCADFGSLGADGEEVRCGLREDEVSGDEEDNKTGAAGEGGVSAAGGAGSVASSIRSSIFTRKQAIALQQALLEGFSGDAFQRDLRAIQKRRASNGLTPTEFVQARQDLFLTIQGRILPRFGFEGSTAGVYKMMGAMGPFVKDPEFIELANQINDLIGVNSKPDTWGDLSASCQKLDAQPQDQVPGLPAAKPKPKPKPKPAGTSRLGIGFGGGFLAGGFGMPSRQDPSVPQAEDNDPRERARAQQAEAQAVASAAWPAGRPPPFKLYVVGTFNDWSPTEMDWDPEGSLFVCPIQVAETGRESFQLLVDGSFEKTLYPNTPDASCMEEHQVRGPDGRGHGKNWLIGGRREEQARPGRNFAVCAALDGRGKVRLIDWQPF